MSNQDRHDLLANRRQFIGYFTSIGLSSTLLPGVLWAKVHQRKALRISKEMLKEAEKIAGLHFSESQRDMMVEGVNQNLRRYDELRQIHLDVCANLADRTIRSISSADRSFGLMMRVAKNWASTFPVFQSAFPNSWLLLIFFASARMSPSLTPN